MPRFREREAVDFNEDCGSLMHGFIVRGFWINAYPESSVQFPNLEGLRICLSRFNKSRIASKFKTF
jgi:hypothetical protein